MSSSDELKSMDLELSTHRSRLNSISSSSNNHSPSSGTTITEDSLPFLDPKLLTKEELIIENQRLINQLEALQVSI